MNRPASAPRSQTSPASRFSAWGRSSLLLIGLALVSLAARPASKSELPARASEPTAARPAPERPCDDAIPPECKKVRFLGEEKGCACFECNPGTKQAKVVCTKDEQKKKDLYAKVTESADAGQE